MPKDKITDYSATAASNTDIGGINIGENCAFGNVNDALRELQSHLAETNAGTYPVADTWTFGDPADLTKRVRLDAGNVTTGQTRVVSVPDQSGTMVFTTGTQTLSGKSFADTTDNSKVLAFSLSGIATSTTRTMTWPNISGTVMVSTAHPTLSAVELLSFVAGDTLYFSGANTPVRLPKGTAYQTLRMKSDATVPEWGGGAIGEGQTWQDVTASRAIGTVYQNTTGRAIHVNVMAHGNDSAAESIFVFEVASTSPPTIVAAQDMTTNFDNAIGPCSIIVPSGHYYRFRLLSGANTTYTLKRWSELR